MNLLKLKTNQIKLNKMQIEVTGPLGIVTYKLPRKLIIFNDVSNSFYIKKKKKLFFYNLLTFLLNSVTYGWYFEFDIKGKGFKLFEYNQNLAFDLGYSNLFLFKNKNKNIKIFIHNKKIIVYSIFKEKIFQLIHVFKGFYHIDKYHHKGLSFKNDKKQFLYKKLM